MSEELTRGRRFVLAGMALAIAGVLFRSEVAQALVVRGDDYMYRGEQSAALERYRRALALDPSFEAAADRYVFVSVQIHTPAALSAGIAVAGAYLSRHPDDPRVLSDRALCYLHQRRFIVALRDFERAARISRRPQDYVFAGWAARRAHRYRAARTLWLAALALRPKYAPARIALEEQAR